MLFQNKHRIITTFGRNLLTVTSYRLQVENLQPVTCNLQQKTDNLLVSFVN